MASYGDLGLDLSRPALISPSRSLAWPPVKATSLKVPLPAGEVPRPLATPRPAPSTYPEPPTLAPPPTPPLRPKDPKAG